MRMFDQAAIRVDLYAHVIMKLSSFMILPHFIFLPVYLTWQIYFLFKFFEIEFETQSQKSSIQG